MKNPTLSYSVLLSTALIIFGTYTAHAEFIVGSSSIRTGYLQDPMGDDCALHSGLRISSGADEALDNAVALATQFCRAKNENCNYVTVGSNLSYEGGNHYQCHVTLNVTSANVDANGPLTSASPRAATNSNPNRRASPKASFGHGMPVSEGQCVFTRVSGISNRLSNTQGSGSAVRFTNGGYLVSYDQLDAVDSSRAGDRVQLCMKVIDETCPEKSGQGAIDFTNLRTKKRTTLDTSEHQCAGA